MRSNLDHWLNWVVFFLISDGLNWGGGQSLNSDELEFLSDKINLLKIKRLYVKQRMFRGLEPPF
jgi:hypothetical protein